MDLKKNEPRNAVLVKANKNLTDRQRAILRDRPVLSAERVSHINKPTTVCWLTVRRIWCCTPAEASHQDRLAIT
jgi:hypothetical protein